MLIALRSILAALSEFAGTLDSLLAKVLKPFYGRHKRDEVLVWNGQAYVHVRFVALLEDGYEFEDMVVHHRSRKKNDESPGNLVLLSPEHHRLVHLVEDHYDIDNKVAARPNGVELGIYADLPEHCKKKKAKRAWASI